jgi:putative ABC transport system substrate-binding protein
MRDTRRAANHWHWHLSSEEGDSLGIRRAAIRARGISIDRRALLATLVASGLVRPAAVRAQPTPRRPRIGVLGTAYGPTTEVLRQALREHGWIEGENITIEWRWSGGRPELYAEHAAEFARLPVDLILAPGSAQVEAARRATRTIPIVFTLHEDPVGAGHVASLARPGGNITGVSLLLTELSAKQLELLKETLPTLTRVGVLRNSAFPAHALAVKAMTNAASRLGLILDPVDAGTPDEFDPAFRRLARVPVGAIVVLTSTIVIKERERLGKVAQHYRLPVMFGAREPVRLGGLMSYGPDVAALVRRFAVYADRVLRGTSPADLPVEQAAIFELVVNLKMAKTLDVTIPPSVLARADMLIE